MTDNLNSRIAKFLTEVVDAMGLELTVEVEPLEDGTRINIDGDDGDVLLQDKAEGLDALQHIVNACFRREHPSGHIVVDCNSYRKGEDEELRQTARLLAERVRETGEPEEVGPLNPYARRIVHLTVAEIADVSSESTGDAFMKSVVISAEG